MSSRISVAIVALVIALCGSGCSRAVLKPGTTSLEDFSVACPRNQVFDQSLSFAQERNLEVKVLEKSSGLIRFERSTLGASDLDHYCTFPWVDSRTNQPAGTYESWADEYEGRPVGTVNLNVLLSEAGPASTKVSVRGNWTAIMEGTALNYTGPVSSNGTLEDQLRQYLEGQQACSTSSSSSNAEKLEQLRRLRDKGLITPEDFQRKQRALGD